jgi:parallel beta-helix repeat protein
MAVVNVDIKNTSGIEDGSARHPYSKIQKGVDAANAGDTVKVAVGTYTEGISINKSIFLEGAGEDKTTISLDPGTHNPIINISNNDVKVSELTITSPNRRGTGIIIRDASRITISRNKMIGLSYGIELRGSASHVKISANTVTNNGYGILFRQTGGGYSNCTIENNVVTNNSYGNINLNEITNSIIRKNNVKGGSRYYAGIGLAERCSYNVIESNEIESTLSTGIVLTVLNGMAPTYNTITRNTVKLNPNYGIYIGAGSPKSSNNKIYHNNIIDNKTQAGDGGENNLWDNGAWEGNYWSDYTGEDTNNDGIGDTKVPHVGLDSYPLMKPFEIDITPPPAPTLVQSTSPTKQTPITLTGTAEPKSTVQVFVNGVAQRSAGVSEAGSFSIDVDLDEGENRIITKAIDVSGNISEESQPVVVILDTIPPDAPIHKPLPQTTNKVKIVVEGSAELNSKVEIFVNKILKGSARANGAGDFTVEVELGEGMNVITATATDASGNISKPSSLIPVLYQKQDDVNIAINPDRAGYPHPLESDRGWGGGSEKWEIIDGKCTYPGEWARGLAFTGGRRNWAGEPCGERQATINFGEPKTFYKVIIWHHGLMHVPKECKLQYWDGSKWIDIASKREVDLEGDYGTWSAPDIHTFIPVTGSKVRYVINNCKESMEGKVMEHGWIYEFDVYGGIIQPPEPEHLLENLPVIAIMGVGKVYAEKLKAHGVKTVREMTLADVFTLGKKTGISLFRLYMWKRRASLTMDVKIDRALFSNILRMRLGGIMTMPDEELSRKANQPLETISDVKKEISTLLISLDNAIVKSMTIERVAT